MRFFKFIIVLITIIVFSSCRSLKKMRMFRQDIAINKELLNPNNEYLLSNDDQLLIYLQDLDPENYAFLVPKTTEDIKAFSDTYSKTMIIRENGYLKLPFLDSLYVKGKSLNWLNDTLTILYSQYIQNPTVHVRLQNFYVNVLGEVRDPGIKNSVNGEKFTLQEAFSLSGGPSLNGNRKEVFIFRNEDGVNKKFIIDLTSENLLIPNSVYLKKGDLIYVQETRRSFLRTDAQLLLFATNALSTILTMVLVISRL